MTHRSKPEQVQQAFANPAKDNQHLRIRVSNMCSFGKGQYELNKRRGLFKLSKSASDKKV